MPRDGQVSSQDRQFFRNRHRPAWEVLPKHPLCQLKTPNDHIVTHLIRERGDGTAECVPVRLAARVRHVAILEPHVRRPVLV